MGLSMGLQVFSCYQPARHVNRPGARLGWGGGLSEWKGTKLVYVLVCVSVGCILCVTVWRFSVLT